MAERARARVFEISVQLYFSLYKGRSYVYGHIFLIFGIWGIQFLERISSFLIPSLKKEEMRVCIQLRTNS